MVGAPAAADAVERARRLPKLRVGLHVVLVDGGANKCTVANQDCTAFNAINNLSTSFGVQTQCYDVQLDAQTGVWAARTCDKGCPNGACDTASGKCLSKLLTSVCDPQTFDMAGVCHGQCLGRIGCGTPDTSLADAGDEDCGETRWCGPDPYDANSPYPKLRPYTPDATIGHSTVVYDLDRLGDGRPFDWSR